jgi:hypothetical protein
MGKTENGRPATPLRDSIEHRSKYPISDIRQPATTVMAQPPQSHFYRRIYEHRLRRQDPRRSIMECAGSMGRARQRVTRQRGRRARSAVFLSLLIIKSSVTNSWQQRWGLEWVGILRLERSWCIGFILVLISYACSPRAERLRLRANHIYIYIDTTYLQEV